MLGARVLDLLGGPVRDKLPAIASLHGTKADIAEMLFDENGSWKKEIRASLKQSLDSIDREEFWAILKKCLGSLPGRHADVFTLRTMDDLSAESICQSLKITSSNYWVILHRARLQLSGCMKQQWFNEGQK